MTDEEYWKKRNEELEAVWNQKSKKEIEKELAKFYRQSLEHIEAKINALYAHFADDNGLDMVEAQRLLQGSEFRTWRMDAEDYLKEIKQTGNKELEKEFNVLAMRSRITRLDKLKAETIVELAKLGEKIGKGIDGFLPSAYQDFYYHSLFDIGKHRSLLGAVSRVNSKELEGVLRTPWSGMNYSQRIWKNSKKLSDVLEKEVFAAAHRGATVKEMSRIVSQKMSVSLSSAIRLVRTELNYIENRAVHDSIKKSGMKYYRFVATLDKRTSQQCRSHDGNIYPIDDYSPGTNAPPLHPHCRSVIVGSLKGDARPTGNRAARDENNQYTRIPASTTYSQWVASLQEAAKTQYFKPVTLSSATELVERPSGTVPFRQVTTQPNIHIAEGVRIKPKQMHDLQNHITHSASILGVKDFNVLPDLYILNEVQLGSNAIALYNRTEDRVYISTALLDPDKLPEIQKDSVLPENPLSTLLHELIHWKDAYQYRKLHSGMEGYWDWLQRKCKKCVVSLSKKSYNIDVSQYALACYMKGRFDEVYTEIRTKELLERSGKK